MLNERTDRSRRGERAWQFAQEVLDIPRKPLQFERYAVRVIPHPAAKLMSAREPINIRPKTDALEDPLQLDSPALVSARIAIAWRFSQFELTVLVQSGLPVPPHFSIQHRHLSKWGSRAYSSQGSTRSSPTVSVPTFLVFNNICNSGGLSCHTVRPTTTRQPRSATRP